MKTLLLSLSLVASIMFQAQDHPSSRLIFIGDAGISTKEQNQLITDAANQTVKGKTTVVFLGNNIFPDGMPAEGDHNKEEAILKSQYQPFLEKGIPVYFIAGNRDWDNSGPSGLQRLMAQSSYLNDLKNPLVHFLPENGCPDPIVVPVSDQSIMILMDSEWWLFPYLKNEEIDLCGAHSERDIELTLRQIFFKNRDKNIFLVMHHPTVTYGNHGGKFSWKDHLFPLTEANQNLYLPLPIVGSLYPLFRRVFPNAEDTHHPDYQHFIKIIEKVFKDFPNLSVISSHDDGAQLIKLSENLPLQVVTGIGQGKRYNQKAKGTLFNSQNPGYLVADVSEDQQIQFQFFGLQKNKVDQEFNYIKKHLPFENWKETKYPEIKGDSIDIEAYPGYDKVGKFGRLWLGDNYRHEWAAKVQLPVIRISEIYGGLTPVKLGGGYQSTSLRLKDPTGKEYILRSVEKGSGKVIPEELRTNLTSGLVEDFFSSQHPYSALIVPPIAEAAGVPHAHPIIGVVAPDEQLGEYQSLFVGKANLLEEREPLPPTDNYTKAFKQLIKDNDNTYDAINFLNARMLDLLIGDWDRHKDQWRFHYQLNGKDKSYTLVPRDRDMVLSKINGVIPYVTFHFLLMPYVYGFQKDVLAGSNYYLYKSAFMNRYPENQLSREVWLNTAKSFKEKVTDQVLEEAVQKLPKGLDPKRNAEILVDLKARRDKIPEAIDKYYKFSNSIVDILASDKNEFVSITSQPENQDLTITMRKISKKGNLADTLMSKTYSRRLTKEVRIYLSKGDDSVFVDNPTSPIKLRIIGGTGQKTYNIRKAKRKIHVYDEQPEQYLGATSRLLKKISKDTANTGFTPVNLYHGYQPLLAGGYNPDDGILLGVGFRFQQARGFKRFPYSATHTLTLAHSFTTDAFHFKYQGEWIRAIGNADFVVDADIKSPQNTQNFFGIGNETPFDKTGNYRRFYRARFNWYTLNTSLRWKNNKGSSLNFGPSIQYYEYDKNDNKDRFISQTALLHSSDSAFVTKDKTHLGIVVNYELDKRNDKTIPTYGTLLEIGFKAYTGLNSYSKSYLQISPEFTFYKNLNEKQTLILVDRLGGNITMGKPAFYQYAYLGGQGNLLGYRQYRFAGMHSLYNNLELRLLLSRFGNAAFQGQFGVNGFYDLGRVWAKNETSNKWHNGIGAGVYLVPAMAFVLQFNMGYSPEGWFPTFTMGFRF